MNPEEKLSKINYDIIEGIIIFDKNDKIYNDHFPGKKVVPGSLIVCAFIDICKKKGMIKNIYKIEKFKFIKFVSPGEYSYKIQTYKETKSINNKIEFSLFINNRIFVKGIIKNWN